MKQKVFVASVMSDVNLPTKELENFANKYAYASSISNEDFELPGYENISWRFLNTYVTGSVEIVFANDDNNNIICAGVPTATEFIVSCMKARNGKFELQFGVSLS